MNLNRRSLACIFLSVGFCFSASFAHAAHEISDGSVQALYHLNDASGTNPYVDSSGNGFDATNTNVSRTPTSSLLTYGAYYTESGSVLENDANVGLNADWTIAGWIRPEADLALNKGYVLDSVHDTSTKNFAVVWYGNSGGNYYIQGDFQRYAVDNCYVTYWDTLTLNSWHYIVYEAHGTKNDLYLDDALIAANTCPNTGGSSGDVSRILVGKDAGTIGAQSGAFSLDELAYFNAAISTTTRSDLYNSGNGQEICVTAGCGGGSSSSIPSIVTSSLHQYQANATTMIAEGETTTESAVVFGATLNSSSSGNTLKLQVEVSTSSAFTNAFTATSNSIEPTIDTMRRLRLKAPPTDRFNSTTKRNAPINDPASPIMRSPNTP